MKNLLNFLKKFKDVLIFFGLQVFILGYFFNSKNYHKAEFLNSSSVLSGWMFEKRENITKHFSLEAENDSLAIQNAILLAKQPLSYYKLQDNLFQINDTIYKQQYSYFPAKVINSTINKSNNYITINKGLLSGVKKEMGVICKDGIVGFVMDVSDHYSIVKTILSDKVNISAQIIGDEVVKGQIKWNGKNFKYCKLHGITSDISLEEGQGVFTKGSKGTFPEGIKIGMLTKNIIDDGSLTLDIEVKLSTNFNTLNTVYLITNNFKVEQNDLENQYFNE